MMGGKDMTAAEGTTGVRDPASSGSWLRRKIVAQFRRPSGLLGRLAGWIMARRGSNVQRNLETVRLLQIEAGDRVLEVGFGPGVAIAAAAQLVGDGCVFGIDHSAAMVAMAGRRNAGAIASGRVVLRQGEVAELEDEGLEFDKVYAVNVFHFWPDAVAVLRRLRSCMATGARIAITHQPRHKGATNADAELGAEKIAEALRDAGFTHVTIEMIRMHRLDAACVLGRVSRKAA